MGRIRTAFISGVTTNNPLTSGGTTLNSASLAGLPVIASPDVAVIVLDPAGSAGNPEVVYVTAHSSAATSATIARAKESTSAREHAVGTPWVHAPTLLDFGLAKPEWITPLYPPFGVDGAVGVGNNNDCWLSPLTPITADLTVTSINLRVTASSGNIDVGICEFDGTTFTRIVSLGSTASPGTGNQSFNITDTTLYRGTRYYLAIAADNTTFAIKYFDVLLYVDTIPTTRYKASAFPIPATMVAPFSNYNAVPAALLAVS